MPRTRKKTKAAPPAPKAKAKAPVAQTERRVVKRRGRRRGLLTGLGHHEHERDILDQYLHEVSKTPLLTQKEEIALDRKSTRLNSSHVAISYAVFCLKKKKVDGCRC